MEMKSNDIKKVFNQIEADDSMKSRILAKVYKEIENTNENKKISFCNKIKSKVVFINESKKLGGTNMKNKIIGLATAGAIMICGTSIIGNKVNYYKGENGMENPAGVSEQKKEILAIVGTINDIEAFEQGKTIKVVGELQDESKYTDVSVYVHASTNIFEDNKDKLLEVEDLKVGQKVKVYYDGSEIEGNPGKISGLKVIIMK